MLHIGLDLSRRRLDICVLDEHGELVAKTAVPADTDGRLNGGNGPALWMTAEEAADDLRCSISRLRKLTMLKLVPAHRDGGRVLYRREDLNAFIAGGGASTGR